MVAAVKDPKKSADETGRLVGRELATILDRIAAFFLGAGAEADAIRQQLNMSLSRAARRKLGVKFVAHRDFLSLERIVNYWLKHPGYVNVVGRPRSIPFAGEQSICAILRETAFNGKAKNALAALTGLGAVKVNADATYSLTARYCNWQSSGVVAYEPQAAFLMNAVMAATHVVGGTADGHELFWRSSSSELVPATLAGKYLDFLRNQGMSLLSELDDWLSQHEVSEDDGSTQRTRKRMGMGFFPYIQTDEVGLATKKARKPLTRQYSPIRQITTRAHAKNKR
jgi:hypothetical protein